MPRFVRCRSGLSPNKERLLNLDKVLYLESRPDIGPGKYEATGEDGACFGEIDERDLIAAGALALPPDAIDALRKIERFSESLKSLQELLLKHSSA